MLNIYKASAGAGKTYTLTLEYIKLLFNDPKSYRSTLAVTFTNNACDEMKKRILESLYKLSFKPQAKYLDVLQNELLLDESTIRAKAKLLYRDILHNYSFFHIETIDAFTQKIIRNFAKDLGLPPKFSITLNNDEIIENVTQRVLIESVNNPELNKVLVQLLSDDFEEQKFTNLRRAITSECKIFNTELYQESLLQNPQNGEKFNPQPLLTFFDEQKTITKKFVTSIDKLRKQVLTELKNADLQPEDFKGKTRSQLVCFKKNTDDFINEKRESQIKRFEKWLNISDIVGKEKALECSNLYEQKLLAIFTEIIALLSPDSTEYQKYTTAKKLLKHKQGVILAQFIQTELDNYCRDENTFFLSYGNMVLKGIINDSDTPFVYEKIGQQIDNVMIDEFQDTSNLQWGNFKPILGNLLASNKDALVIGDVKQSIYRFRNGDWKLLHNLYTDSDLGHYARNLSLDKNFRSLRNVVEFNNNLFSICPQFFDELFNAEFPDNERYTMRDIYANGNQIVAGNDGGCVEICILKTKEKDQNPLLERIFEKVVELLNAGREPEDIAFLCYRNKDITELVQFFNEKKAEYPQYAQAFSIMSSEALSLNSSKAIQFVTNYLKRLCTDPNSNDAKFINSILLQLYHELFSSNSNLTYEEILSDNSVLEREIPVTLSLYETCEHIIETYSLNTIIGEIPFITDFQSIVYNYSQNNNNNISNFLEHWNDVGDKLKLQQSETPGCMKASTIHKSKGLEYPVVIMPKFLSLSKKIRTLCTTPFNEIKVIQLNDDLSDTIPEISEQYREEVYNSYIDSLNALYVACTRPREELYIFDSPKTTQTANLVECLMQKITFLGDCNEEVLADETVVNTWKIGEKSGSAHKSLESKTIDSYPIYTTQAKLLPDRNSRNFGEIPNLQPTEREHGVLMHRILEHISTTADIDRMTHLYSSPEIIDETEKKQIADYLKQRIANPAVSNWFNGKWDVLLNEQSLLQPHGIEKRPDRVIIRGGNATIVDYKFTQAKPESHKKQVREYMDILSLMGYNPEGFIWYVDLNEIETV